MVVGVSRDRDEETLPGPSAGQAPGQQTHQGAPGYQRGGRAALEVKREMLASSLLGPLCEQSSQPLPFAKCHDVLTPCQTLHMGLWTEPCPPPNAHVGVLTPQSSEQEHLGRASEEVIQVGRDPT